MKLCRALLYALPLLAAGGLWAQQAQVYESVDETVAALKAARAQSAAAGKQA